MAITTVGEFCAVLEKSKLLDTDQLAKARDLVQNSQDATAAAKTLARQGVISRWQAAQLLLGRSTFTLGKYRLIQLLGRGGMGNVCLAEHVTMNRRVALKIISRKVGKDPASLERFLGEARAVAALDHPNIVQAYSVDNEGDRYYLVMEYVEGMDLQRLVEVEGPLDCERAVDYIRQAADGLDHAHQRNMIHCDIKPANLLINPQGVIKILDMGLAKLTDEEKPGGGEQDDRVLGSVDYLAPEQALGSPSLDGRADIYSLGCTFYFLLTGHPPFPQGSLHERILRHQTQEPAAIRAERPEVPAELAAVCAKMMAKNPADRYQTAGEVSRQLAERRPASPRLPRGIPLLRAKPIDDSASEAVFDAEFEKEAARSPLDLLGPAGSLDARLATLTGSNPNLATLDAGLVLAPRREASSKPGIFGLSTAQQRVLVAGSAGLAVVVVAVIIGVVVLGQGGSRGPSANNQPRSAAHAELTLDDQSTAVAPAAAKREPSKKTKDLLEKIEKVKAQPAGKSPAPPQKRAPEPKPQEAAQPPAAKPATDVAPPPEVKPASDVAPPPKPTDPLQGLAAAVDLPPLPADHGPSSAPQRPVLLGNVKLPPTQNFKSRCSEGRMPLAATRAATRSSGTRSAERVPVG